MIIVVATFALNVVQDAIVIIAQAVSCHVSNWIIVLSYDFVFLIKSFFNLRIFLSLPLPTVNGHVRTLFHLQEDLTETAKYSINDL